MIFNIYFGRANGLQVHKFLAKTSLFPLSLAQEKSYMTLEMSSNLRTGGGSFPQEILGSRQLLRGEDSRVEVLHLKLGTCGG